MAGEKIIINRVMKEQNKAEVFHTSGYAQAQSGAGMGAVGASKVDLAKREAFDQQRKLIQGYRNSKIMQGVRGMQRAQKFVPRTEGGVGALGSDSGERARIGRGDEMMRGGDISRAGERAANGLRGGTPRGGQPIARGGERNR